MEKDCTLFFTDETKPYPFNSADIGKALKVAHERNWPVRSIKTPEYMLEIFTHEEYEKATSEKLFSETAV